jgi:O-antigen chain-terminating methyltransferase
MAFDRSGTFGPGPASPGAEDRAVNDAVSPAELDVLMERLRAEIAARAAVAKTKTSGAAGGMANAASARGVRQLLALPGADFVDAAFRAVLGRDPDPERQGAVQRRLDIGLASRSDVLVELRWSEEGRAQGRHVPGLAWLVVRHRLRNARLNKAVRSGLRLLRNIPRLALYMRSVVERVDGAERRAANAEAAAMRATAELARAQEAIRALTVTTADLANRVARLESTLPGASAPATAEVAASAGRLSLS